MITKDRYLRAKEIVDLYLIQNGLKTGKPEIRIRVNETFISRRTLNTLKYFDIIFWDELADFNYKLLLKHKGCGKKTLIEIEEGIKKYNNW